MRSSPKAADSVAAIAVPVPGLGLLSYRVPGGRLPPKGARVTVPLGSRTVIGCVVGPAATPPPAGTVLKDVVAVIDDEPFLPPGVVDLALWVGEYYASGPGDALAIAMPPAARRGGRAFRTVAVVDLAADGAGTDAPIAGARQRELVERLQRDGATTMPALAAAGVSRATVRALAARGRVVLRDEVVLRDPFGGRGPAEPAWTIAAGSPETRPLTDEQTQALGELRAAADARAFRPVLLHGVTGSGKTEIYLRLARHVLSGGRRVLLLVPEIALTPALAGLLRARFGSRVAIQHSGLSAGERHDQWQRIRHGEIDVVVGTRSAVFAPLEHLGLIVVDEEHESSYKQDESPRYHGRDVAVVRARMEGAVVLLASATPSLESAANARSGRYGLIRLTKRVLDRPLAAVRVVDMRAEFAEHGTEVTLSGVLLEAIAERLGRGEQSLVLLNRRGFATVVFCRGCGATIECPHCSVSLTYHRGVRRLRCHFCNHATRLPAACAECGGAYLEQAGFGTERIEAELAARFPTARLARVDRDTVRRRGAIAEVLRRVAAGQVDILVGTQMLAKGHDFPAVTLAGVVSADVGLGRADFRAAERTFQLITQVVGRAGRGDVPGQAVIQTLYPDHYAIRAAAAQDYDAFFAREMEFREGMGYPPVTALINVIVRAASAEQAMSDAADLARRLRDRRAAGRIIGPAPAATPKIKDQHRAQFFVKGARERAVRQALVAALDARPDLKRRTIVDVDPVSMT